MGYYYRLLSALLTAYYSTKLLYLAFYAIPAGSRARMEVVFESGFFILYRCLSYLYLVFLVVIYLRNKL